LKSFHSSWISKDQKLAEFTKTKAQPSAVLNMLGGFPSQLVIDAELNGKPTAVFVAIMDSHEVSSETLGAYAPVVNDLLGMGVDFDGIWQFPKFKETLKEANNKGHNIFN
jgi:hypothetical protein